MFTLSATKEKGNIVKKIILHSVFLFVFLYSSFSFADAGIAGISADVGAPDGVGLGLVVRPLAWVRLNGHIMHNSAAPGYRVGVTLDPIDFPVAPTATAEYGSYAPGRIIGIEKSPFVWYNYANVHLGLEFGKRDYFRFYLRGGVSSINVETKAVSYLVGGKDFSLVSDPKLSAILSPTFKLGFVKFF